REVAVGLVEEDERRVGAERVEEGEERRPLDDRPRRIVRRAEDHGLRPTGDLPAHVFEVSLVPGERACDDPRAREGGRGRVRLEGGLGDDDLVAPLERRERHERDQLVGAVADDELLGCDAEPPGEGLTQREGAAVGVEVHARRLVRDRGDDARRRAEGVLVRRQALAEGYDALKGRHAEGASGEESVRTHARLMDDVILSLTRLIAADAVADGLEATPLVVIALGGYGRGELHPLSDVDLMVIYDDVMSPYVQRMMQELLYSLWDLGLHVGHSLRSLDDCVAMARTDFPSRTSMQEARFLAGE